MPSHRPHPNRTSRPPPAPACWSRRSRRAPLDSSTEPLLRSATHSKNQLMASHPPMQAISTITARQYSSHGRLTSRPCRRGSVEVEAREPEQASPKTARVPFIFTVAPVLTSSWFTAASDSEDLRPHKRSSACSLGLQKCGTLVSADPQAGSLLAGE